MAPASASHSLKRTTKAKHGQRRIARQEIGESAARRRGDARQRSCAAVGAAGAAVAAFGSRANSVAAMPTSTSSGGDARRRSARPRPCRGPRVSSHAVARSRPRPTPACRRGRRQRSWPCRPPAPRRQALDAIGIDDDVLRRRGEGNQQRAAGPRSSGAVNGSRVPRKTMAAISAAARPRASRAAARAAPTATARSSASTTGAHRNLIV